MRANAVPVSQRSAIKSYSDFISADFYFRCCRQTVFDGWAPGPVKIDFRTFGNIIGAHDDVVRDV